uniref:Venom polypeptide n=1 Tax=Dolopus genitalis TaxID=2488630 RepID=A0A3G5BIE3_DOLGE|nr:venom polypeptide [Dolopus genitalis]
MKYFMVFAFAIIACLSAVSASNSTFGAISPSDSKLHEENVFKSASPLRIVTKDVKFGYKGNRKVITGIRVIDRMPKQKGGRASLLHGGPGHKNVTIHLKSQRNNGIFFTVEIYGR